MRDTTLHMLSRQENGKLDDTKRLLDAFNKHRGCYSPESVLFSSEASFNWVNLKTVVNPFRHFETLTGRAFPNYKSNGRPEKEIVQNIRAKQTTNNNKN